MADLALSLDGECAACWLEARRDAPALSIATTKPKRMPAATPSSVCGAPLDTANARAAAAEIVRLAAEQEGKR